LENGESCYVIGRKGSGKTAIAEYFRNLKGHDVFVRTLSFKNFTFNELYKLEDKGFTRPSQYTTLWKYLIYGAVCSMMAENEALDGTVTSVLRKHFDVNFEKALASSISKLTDQSGGLTILGTGANAARKSIVVPYRQGLDCPAGAAFRRARSHPSLISECATTGDKLPPHARVS
jgi:hypothetical protein